MSNGEYEFPEEDFFGVVEVSTFRHGKMYVKTEGQSVGVNIPDDELWDKRFKRGDTLEVYVAPDNFTHYRKYVPQQSDE